MTEENRVTYTKKYTYYSLFVLGLINIIDIFTSNVGPLVVSFVVDEFLISKGANTNAKYNFKLTHLYLIYEN